MRAFARRLDVNLWAVQKAVASGRLLKSLGKGTTGSTTIANVELALREWNENASQTPGPTSGDGGRDTVAEAQRLVHLERREALRLANEQKHGRLLDAAAVSRDQFDCARTLRDAIFAIDDRLSERLAAETDPGRVHRMLREEHRIALASVARILGDDHGGEPRPSAVANGSGHADE